MSSFKIIYNKIPEKLTTNETRKSEDWNVEIPCEFSWSSSEPPLAAQLFHY